MQFSGGYELSQTAVVETEREAMLQSDLYYAIRKCIEQNPRIGECTFLNPEWEYENADIVVMRSKRGQAVPWLVIETKRKGPRQSRLIDPMSLTVIRQAIGYAVSLGAHFFATANRELLAVFEIPSDGEPFSIVRHTVLVTQLDAINADLARQVLELLCHYEEAGKDKRDKVRAKLDRTFVFRLRSFVSWLSRYVEPALNGQVARDDQFRTRMESFLHEKGIPDTTTRQLAREMSYVLMNRLLFYKILERQNKELKPMKPFSAPTAQAYLQHLESYFSEAIRTTSDFEAVFSIDFYDEIPLEDNGSLLVDAIDGINSFIEELDSYEIESLHSDIIGHVYEDLIPAQERKQLGQFYTPPEVADMICQWALRDANDRVLDPACGSGTFLVKAYQKLSELKKTRGPKESQDDVHEQIINQLYGIDINPFPAQLTAINLAMRNISGPVSKVRVLQRDFFVVEPETAVLAGFPVQTPRGAEKEFYIEVPKVDAVVGNPPYTRGQEIPPDTLSSIRKRMDPTLRKYGLQMHMRAGIEPGIYMYFVMYSTYFLREGGRLAMIVSNSWLQNMTAGPRFARFLLDKFRIHAVIDFAEQLFDDPEVATCILLLERCKDNKAREDTQTCLLYVRNKEVLERLTEIVNGKFMSPETPPQWVKQRDLPKEHTWINLLMDTAWQRIDRRIATSLGTLCLVTRGTVSYCAENKRGTGANPFFYLNDETARQWDLERYVSPLLSSVRYSKRFIFSREDWEAIRTGGGPCWVLNCRKPRSSLPKGVRMYIDWGEKHCKTKEGVVCSDSQACKERALDKAYAGWYDLGGVFEAAMFGPRYIQYKLRFALLSYPAVLDDDLIAFVPKVRLTTRQKKALMAYLNSSYAQLYVELSGRTTGMGMVALEAETAANMPVIDPRKLSMKAVEDLATAFDKLAAESKQIGGAQTLDGLRRLKVHLDKLDYAVTKALGFTRIDLVRTRDDMKRLVDRRLERSKSRSRRKKTQRIHGTTELDTAQTTLQEQIDESD